MNERISFGCVDDISRAVVHTMLNPDIKNQNLHLFSESLLSYSLFFKQMEKDFKCKEVDIQSWLEQYQKARIMKQIDVIPFVELMLGIDSDNIYNLIKESKHEFSSYVTHKFLNKNNIIFNPIDENYISSIIKLFTV